MKKILFPLCLVLVFVPMTASALWWNPFTWKIFQRQEPVAQTEITIEKKSEDKINELQRQLDDLKRQQASSTSAVIPSTTIQATKKEVKKIVTNPVTVSDICPEIEGIQTVVPVGYVRNGAGQCVLAGIVQQTQAQPQPKTVVPTEKNFYLETKSRLRELIAIEQSYVAFLQDTNNQLRSASLTLSGYNTGGLYGQAKDAAIDLSNAMISAHNSLIMKNKSDIASLEAVLDAFNADPNSFVSEDTFNSKIPNPQNVRSDIESAQRDVSEKLNEVLKTLQFH